MPVFGSAARHSLTALATTAAVSLFSAPLAFADVSMRSDLSEADKRKVAKVISPTEDFSKAEAFEVMQAGAATSQKRVNRDAFSHPSANITFKEQQTFRLGNGMFKKLWVSSPSSTQASDGLGPLYNARSCQGCHLKDGRGHPPREGEKAVSMFLRLSVPAKTEEQRQAMQDGRLMALPEPTYGGQFQNFAVPGLPGEGKMTIAYEDVPVEFADGTVVHLRKPTYGVSELAYGPMAEDVQLSPRVAPQMIGLGLLEAIADTDILANVDADDRDGDGISGRVSWVADAKSGEKRIGRFGWKASNASVRTQSAGAFAGDIGISSPDAPQHYGDCTANQQACLAMPTGVQKRLGDTEAPDPVMDLVEFYSKNLAVPARRNADDAQVLRGKELFYASGCIACHTPKYVTSRKADNKAQQFQLIWPYTDLLLHDMGEGLADHRPVGSANGYEWKTPPLWGIGLTETVNGHTFFLHDGRARNLLEAVLWHGGEAEAAKNHVLEMTHQDRQALVKFLESL
ncbi:di-heme oxidoredictase family protein [Polycladidibacter hongkongensis]|uniref:di-heme oxidoreductase family protein n=1 Tax=Polycladidibacter hongkongensis TaxID=1647556 RepID=UPI00082FD29D|nr:di-heme oxidoredictase family protein [Pseudovibrio hongkongensis]